jgi:hypothetical protein
MTFSPGPEKYWRLRQGKVRIRDPRSSMELTTNQWCKRILAMLANEHHETIEKYLDFMEKDHKAAVKKDLDRLTRNLLTYKGYPLDP